MGVKTNRLESLIALGILFFVLCVLGGVYYKYYGHRHKTATFYAEFDSISGLNIGAPVKINGVVVGNVVGFDLDQKKNFVVSVEFAVHKDIVLPEDTRASATSESLFGSTILMLLPGISERMLPHGGTIFDTQSPLHIHELLQKFMFNSSESDRETAPNREQDDSDKLEREQDTSDKLEQSRKPDKADCMV